MINQRQSGLTFYELVVALLILALMGASVVPRLRHKTPSDDREQLVSDLNGIFQNAWQNAITKNKTHKILFDLGKRTCQAWILTVDKIEKDEDDGEPLGRAISWPKEIEIVQFYINGEDEIEKCRMDKEAKIWTFIIPNGLAQQAILNVVDSRGVDGAIRFGLVLNPFVAQFKVYDGFRQP